MEKIVSVCPFCQKHTVRLRGDVDDSYYKPIRRALGIYRHLIHHECPMAPRFLACPTCGKGFSSCEHDRTSQWRLCLHLIQMSHLDPQDHCIICALGGEVSDETD
jgi:hypothetical protein